MEHKPKQEDIELLYQALIALETKEECAYFLADLCTKKEVESMAMRLASAKLLMEGKTYDQVIEATKISSATLARVSTCVRYGKGYQTILKKK
jgi:TrpR-related protein YerC/YecD